VDFEIASWPWQRQTPTQVSLSVSARGQPPPRRLAPYAMKSDQILRTNLVHCDMTRMRSVEGCESEMLPRLLCLRVRRPAFTELARCLQLEIPPDDRSDAACLFTKSRKICSLASAFLKTYQTHHDGSHSPTRHPYAEPHVRGRQAGRDIIGCARGQVQAELEYQ
jgi:hypothetical protein